MSSFASVTALTVIVGEIGARSGTVGAEAFPAEEVALFNVRISQRRSGSTALSWDVVKKIVVT